MMSATLRHAHLRGASLRHACLKAADLTGACLVGADFTGASLRQASLSGTNLCGAICLWNDEGPLTLEGALYDGRTLLPPAFHPHEHGLIRCLGSGRA
jgi:uncharacterized protein YjbI with pentapeptide repeats